MLTLADTLFPVTPAVPQIMPKPLTPPSIAALRRKPTRYEVPDGGCTGLRVVVFPSKHKSYIIRFRFKGLSRKLTLGPCLIEEGVAEPSTTPKIGTPLSLVGARQLCTTALRDAKAGTDPCAARQRERQEKRGAGIDTLAAIAAEYLRREGPRLRTIDQREADLKLVTDALGRLPVADIKRSQYTHVFDGIANKGPVRADRVVSALRTLLKWHSKRTDNFISPLVSGRLYSASTSERARERTLTDDELRAVWLAAEQDKTPFGPYVRFLLLTATRRNEAGGLRRGELSADGSTWLIPAARYKNGKDHVVPLSAAAQAIIAAMPAGEHVFGGVRPLSGFNDRKKAFDKACGVSGWTLHDLRRTSRTLLSRAGISADHAERCLGHVIGGVRGVYDRFQYLDEKRQGFDALAALVERIVRPTSGVVVALKKARRK